MGKNIRQIWKYCSHVRIKIFNCGEVGRTHLIFVVIVSIEPTLMSSICIHWLQWEVAAVTAARLRKQTNVFFAHWQSSLVSTLAATISIFSSICSLPHGLHPHPRSGSRCKYAPCSSTSVPLRVHRFSTGQGGWGENGWADGICRFQKKFNQFLASKEYRDVFRREWHAVVSKLLCVPPQQQVTRTQTIVNVTAAVGGNGQRMMMAPTTVKKSSGTLKWWIRSPDFVGSLLTMSDGWNLGHIVAI